MDPLCDGVGLKGSIVVVSLGVTLTLNYSVTSRQGCPSINLRYVLTNGVDTSVHFGLPRPLRI